MWAISLQKIRDDLRDFAQHEEAGQRVEHNLQYGGFNEYDHTSHASDPVCALDRLPESNSVEVSAEGIANCLVSCDHVPRRSWPLFRAKAMLGELIAGFSSPGIHSQQEQLAA
jgi:hypothetical protein